MQVSVLLVVAMIGCAALVWLAWRGHSLVLQSRRALLDDCSDVLERRRVEHAGDGFPRLEGFDRGRLVRVDLVSDTMTIRRLPQLWMVLTRLEARPELAEISVLVRPTGMEFYSLTENHPHRLRVPPELPAECLARGSDASAQRLLDQMAPTLQRIFADPRIKEVGVTKKGLRLVWQAAEGRRGEHLLMRQCIFDDAKVSGDALRARLAQLDALSCALHGLAEAKAA